MSDKQPAAASTDSSAYLQWLQSHVFQRRDGELFEARIASWPAAPRFHIAIVQDDAPVADLAVSIHALAEQLYPHVFVTVSANLPAPAGLSSDRMDWLHSADTWSDANVALSNSSADTWVGVLRAGDRVAPHAFLSIAEYIATHADKGALYSDEDLIEPDGTRHSALFKPDFDIEFLRSAAFVGGLLLATSETWNASGGHRHFPAYRDELDLALRLAEVLGENGIGHVADVLYHRSASHPSIRSSDAETTEQIACVSRHLTRAGLAATATAGLVPGTVRVIYPLQSAPRVSIIVPTKDQFPLLQRCIDSLFSKTDYPDFELLVVDNGSQEQTACAYLDGLTALGDARIRVVPYQAAFNFSAMNNRAAETATGEFLLLLNNDTAILHGDWLTEMVSLGLKPRAGIVGARLLHPDGTLQHAGVTLGTLGPAEHPFISWPSEQPSPLCQTHAIRACSAVTAACLLIRRSLYLEVGGMDEGELKVAYNDVDLCLKVTERGQRILWTPFATLLHEGSASQRHEVKVERKNAEAHQRFAAEQAVMYQRWMPRLTSDPHSNRNLSLGSRDAVAEPEPVLSWNPTPWDPSPRILVHPVDRAGCGEYRILSPAAALHEAGRCRGYASQRFFDPVEIAKAELATVVVQLPTTERHLRAMTNYRAYSGAKCIVEIDDLITDIAQHNPQARHFGPDVIRLFEQATRLGHRLVVPTQALADAFAHLAPEVKVAPNYLAARHWEGLAPQRKKRARSRVGWAGSTSHLGDIALLAEVIPALAKEVDWIFFGAVRPELRRYLKEYEAAVAFSAFPAKLADMDLDLALAPIASNAFNEAKSPLKVLEYGILGYPVVCSDVGPYRHGFPVKRVDNTARAWITAIRERIHDREAARAEGAVLQAHVREHWMLEDHLDEWVSAWT